MVVRLLPNVEALAIDWLKAHDSITALIGSPVARVYTEIPGTPTYPLLTVTLFAGVEKIAEHLDESYVQLAAYGRMPENAGKLEAELLCRTARAVLIAARFSDHDRGVVTDVRTVSTPRLLPDDSTPDTPRPRYLCELAMTVHPHPL